MKKTIITICTIGLISMGHAQKDVAEPQEFLDAIITREQSIGVTGGIFQENTISWSGAAGSVDQEGTVPFTAQTLSRIASITKPMTAVAIMQLAERGELQLEDKVRKYLPAFSKAHLAQITIKQLLQHSSGLSAYKTDKERRNYIHYATLEDALGFFIDRPLDFEPGQAFGYSSYGYTVLGLLIETVSGMSYENYLKTHIWEPANMQFTRLETPGGNSVVYHQKKAGKIKAYPATDLSDRLPGGGVVSTAEDVLRFAQALLNETLITKESLDQMVISSGLKKEGNAYGLGWYLYGDNPVLGTIIGHSGAQLGCSAFLLILPDKQAAVTVIANTSRANGEVWNAVMGLLGQVK